MSIARALAPSLAAERNGNGHEEAADGNFNWFGRIDDPITVDHGEREGTSTSRRQTVNLDGADGVPQDLRPNPGFYMTKTGAFSEWRVTRSEPAYFPISPFHSHYRKEAQNTAHKVHNFRVANYTLGILVRPHQWDGQLDAEQAIPDGP